MLSEGSVSLFENVYHGTLRGVACALHQIIYVFAFHAQCHPNHMGKAMETSEGKALDFFR
jgi:hypothetical protein